MPSPKLIRSTTGNQLLLPAVRPGISKDYLPELPRISASQWTLGHGSVIYTIWPAVLVHTIFVAAIVVITQETSFTLKIPSVMLTVLGVVIGFVISYRAISGYERYWMGRTVWTDIIKNARTASRVIHVHVPPRLTPKTEQEIRSGEARRSSTELLKVMGEKRMAMDLIQGFCFALKHHIRYDNGELGIYYEDLYDLVRPLHDHEHAPEEYGKSTAVESNRPHQVAQSPPLPRPKSVASIDHGDRSQGDQSYGSVSRATGKHRSKRADPCPPEEAQPLLPSEMPSEQTTLKRAQTNLIPFGHFFSQLGRFFRRTVKETIQGDDTPTLKTNRRWQGPLQPKIGIPKGAPRDTGSGENLPLEILRCLSEWCSVLEDRNTVPGTSLGTLMGCIAAFEGSLTSLEMILSTPLPFVYAAHIKHTVWIYLGFLPFQLVDDFGYYTILGVVIASFIYLGFLAAGEEIEQPFGYDENDLDLDLFCREIISDEIEVLKKDPGINAYLGPSHPVRVTPRRSMTLVDLSETDLSRDVAGDDSGNESAATS